MNSHSLYDQEDKHAEEFIQAARKHLFLINNIYSMLTFVKEKVKTPIVGDGYDGSPNNFAVNPLNRRMSGLLAASPASYTKPSSFTPLLERYQERYAYNVKSNKLNFMECC